MTLTLSTPRNFRPGETKEEQVKVVKDGLDVIKDLPRYAKEGAQAIEPDDFMRFKWYGVYQQKPKEDGYFMLRTRIPGGQLNPAQLREIAALTDQFAHGFGDVTTRQTIQLHWLRIEQFPEIFKRLESVGITSSGACGDIARNVVGCPVAGMDPDAILDATPELRAVDAHLTNNPEFSNLPRKYKISISGCSIMCTQPDINCVGVFGLERGKEKGYGIKVGGGLSSAPHLAQTLPVFLRPEDVLPMVHFTSVIYRDHGYRDKRARARLKFLVADWGAEKFITEVERVAGRKFERHTEFVFPEDPESDHVGVHAQTQKGLYWVGVCLAGGRLTGAQMRIISDLSDKYGEKGKVGIRGTNKQNLIIVNVPEKNVAALKQELVASGLVVEPSNFRKGCVSCTGIEFCNLAVGETKNRMIRLVGELEQVSAHYRDKVRIISAVVQAPAVSTSWPILAFVEQRGRWTG
ncbi:MAG: nitrite/sulfite reductase [Verrucomicrobia bacterium]|nr:nitrite/sulfite reductase [Verrucomicrobiota bacterium]